MNIHADMADDERAVELESISAIYPEIVIDPKAPLYASLYLPVSPANPVTVSFQNTVADDAAGRLQTPSNSLGTGDFADGNSSGVVSTRDTQDLETYPISHFPPLLLNIELPEGYPSINPPKFSLCTEPEWLPRSTLFQLAMEGNRLWEDCGRDMVVYSYIDHVQQLAETLFGLHPDPNTTLILARNLKIPLLNFDAQKKREIFNQETFVCGICLEPKKGQVCHRLQRCAHVFCAACLQDFYNTCIDEGDVHSVKCIDPNCGKESLLELADNNNEEQEKKKRHRKPDLTLTPAELLQIPLDPSVVQRYAFLKRKFKLEADKTVIYCPRKWCQGAARSKRFPKPSDPLNISNLELSDDEDEVETFDPLGSEDQLPPMEKRLAICEDCGYAFCRVCKKGWHGPRAFCYPRRVAELTEEEKATENYMQLYTAQCPSCDFRCQKAMGCNHMICSRCKTHFCYLCSAWLFAANPYQHFNQSSSSCYMRLWELDKGDGTGNPANEQRPDPFVAEESDHEDEEFRLAVALEANNNNQHQPPPRAIPPPPGQQPQPRIEIVLPERRAPAANQQGNRNGHFAAQNQARDQNGPQRQREPGIGPGLQRFLYLVQHDMEDEWESDELDEDF